MEQVTLKDIAKALNLSTSTVSRALRDSYQINKKTKNIVIEYAKKVNYIPNPIALSLKGNTSKAIGVIVPEIANHFFSQAINGIEDEAYRRGYHVVIFQSHESLEREVDIIKHLYDRRVDGVLISLSASTKNIDHIKNYSENNFPVVYFDRVPKDENVNKVVVDNFKGAYDATDFLISKGKKRIAHLTSPPELSITVERLSGYKKALADNKIQEDFNLIKFCDFKSKNHNKAINELFENSNPDAFFISSDRIALSFYEEFQKRKLHKKDKYMFFGFTNLAVAHLFNPPLFTVVQPAFEIGVQSAKILLDNLENKKDKPEPKTIILKTQMKTN